MAPNAEEELNCLKKRSSHELEGIVPPQPGPWIWHHELIWFHIIAAAYIHIAGIYGIYVAYSSAKWATLIFMYSYYVFGLFGVIAGTHRLWSHRSYKATLPLQVLLMVGHSTTMQLSVMWWALSHRQHHMFADTDADPHNSTRGFFFSHIGWVLANRHPEVVKRRKFIDGTDLINDPVLKFQKKYVVPIVVAMSLLVPTFLPVLCWGEHISISWYLNMLRFTLTYNGVWMINNFAHGWGTKPYDKNICATQNSVVSVTALGEGFHNYHHTFPWDYRAAELGNNYLNFSTFMIDLFARIGWVYDRKTVTTEMIAARAKRTGDGTYSRSLKTF